MNRLLTAALITSAALAIAACAPTEAPTLDRDALTASLEDISGVESADIGSYNTGAPGQYGLNIELTVEEDSAPLIGAAVTDAVSLTADAADGYRSYAFTVVAPDAGEAVIVTLADYREHIALDFGDYAGSSLTVDADDLD